MFKPTEVSSLAAEVCRVIQSNNKEAYWVGGSVRDILMGREPSDFDIATSASTDQIMRWFTNVLSTGLKHGTVTVMFGKHKFEVTTFRGESSYSNGRSPDFVYPVHSIEEDLSRRDFCFNALAMDPVTGNIKDPFGGAADIMLKRIKCVGDPMERFAEDGLRCLRACRFASTLEFNIENDTHTAICRNVDTYAKVSVERIVSEWRKALKSKKPSYAFEYMAGTGLLSETVPEFADSYECKQNKYHAYNVFDHTLHVLDACLQDEMVQFAALFHDIAKPVCKGANPTTGQATFYNHEEEGADMTRDIMTRLKFSTAEVDKVSTLVKHHLLPREDISNAGLRRWVIRVGEENVDQVLALAQADLEGKGPAEEKIPDDFVSKFRDRVKSLSVKQPIVTKTGQLAVTGHDIMYVTGLTGGPRIGEILNKLLEHVTEHPEANNKKDLLDLVTTYG